MGGDAVTNEQYWRLTAVASLALLLAAAGVLRRAWPFAWRRVAGSWCVAAAGGLLCVPAGAVLGWSVCRLLDWDVVPAWWFATPKTPQVVLLSGACAAAWQVLLTVGLWRAWRAYDAAANADPP